MSNTEQQQLIINCSTYNPCGRYGYCRKDQLGQWACECRFWWRGVLCNEQSSSGKQVIALGVVLGSMILAVWIIKIVRFIKMKRKNRLVDVDFKDHVSEKVIKSSRKFLQTNRSSQKLCTSVMISSTVLLSCIALLVKSLLIKPIHVDMVEKAEKKEPLYFKRHNLCPVIELRREFNIITFPVACLLLVIFAMKTKRHKSRFQVCCRGYGALPMPVDFFAHTKRAFVAVVFAIYADELLDIARELISGSDGTSEQGVISGYLLQIARVLVIGFRRYPILAAVYINTPLTLICATLYTWLDFSVIIFYNSLCRSDYYATERNFNATGEHRLMAKFDYYGTGMKLVYLQLVTDIPQYLCLAYISIKLPVLFYKRYRHSSTRVNILTREQEILLYSSLSHSAETQYVRNLFIKSTLNQVGSRSMEIFHKIYCWRDDFRFSSRVLSVYASVFLLLFFITTQMIIHALPYVYSFQQFIQIIFSAATYMIPMNSKETITSDQDSEFPLPDLIPIFLIAILITLIIVVIQLLIMLVAIRRNLLQAFRGDTSEIPPRQASGNPEHADGNVHFAGYFIGYLLWGYVLIGVFVFMIVLIVGAFFRFGSVRLVERILTRIIPVLLIVNFKSYVNKLASQYLFLQQSGKVLSLGNRRLFMVFVYFNFFLDAFLGFISSITRIGRSIVGGILYMCRLDYAPLGRRLEHMDEGFSSYCGFIHMECAHRHPVMLFFTSHLLRQYLEQTKQLSRASRKWHLIVFLLSNPSCVQRRKTYLRKSSTNVSLVEQFSATSEHKY